MKKLICYSLLFLTSSLILLSKNTVTYNIKKDEPINITYENINLFSETDTIYAFIYCFAESAIPDAYQIMLQKDADKFYHGSFTPPRNTTYGMLKYGNGIKTDNNQQDFYQFFITSNNIPVKGSSLRAGTTYLGNLPLNCRRNPDLSKALDYFNKELSNYPENLLAGIARTSLEFDLKLITDTEYEKSIRQLIKKISEPETDEEIQILVRALRSIGESEKADIMESLYEKDHPKSKLTEEKKFKNLTKVNNLNDFIEKSLHFLKTYPNSDKNEKVYLGLIQSFIQMKDIKKLISLFDSLKVPGEIYAQIANNLISNEELNLNLENSEKLNLSEECVKKSINEIENIKINEKPNYMCEIEWVASKMKKLSEYFFQIGNIRLSSKDTIHALDYYKKSVEILNVESPDMLFEKIIDISFILNNQKDIKKYSEMAIISDNSSTYIDSLNKMSANILQPYNKYEYYYDSLITIRKKIEQAKLNSLYSEQKANLPLVKSINDVNYDTKLEKGKIIIFYTWTNWCEQCVSNLEIVEKLSSYYKSNESVVIIPIHLWSKSETLKSDLQSFVEENKLKIPLYIDSYNEAYRNLSIIGIPSFILIGKQGNINFRINGINSTDDTFDDIVDMINMMLINQ